MTDIRQTPYVRSMLLHLDADAFFASCEQAMDPSLKGKPVVVGAERTIVTAASYEAKKLGVTRGMQVWQVKRDFPQVIIKSSNFQTYGLFSQRMFQILRQYSPSVEEYSIDEGFADLTGLRRPLHMTYQQIAERIQQDIKRDLNIGVSIGIAPTKVLAKIGSKWHKPAGITVISHSLIPEFLAQVKVEDLWGIGVQTASFLNKHNIYTALDLIHRDDLWASKNLSKPYQEIWQELQGTSVYKVDPDAKRTYASISRTRTFFPPSTESRFIYAQLIQNLEGALHKARRYHLAPKKIFVFLKTHQSGGYFKSHYHEIQLSRPSALLLELAPLFKPAFDQLFSTSFRYRATGVILADLQSDIGSQVSLFEDPLRLIKVSQLNKSIDEIKNRFGRTYVSMAATLNLHTPHKGKIQSMPVFKTI